MCRINREPECYQQSSFSTPDTTERPRSRSDIDEASYKSAGTGQISARRGRSRDNTDATIDSSSASVPEPPTRNHIKIHNNSKFLVDVEIEWRGRPKQVGGIRRKGWRARLGFTSMSAGVGIGGGAENQEHFNYENSTELRQRLGPAINGKVGKPIIFERPKECDEVNIILKACIEPKDSPTIFRTKAYDMTGVSYELKVSDEEIITRFENEDLRRLNEVREVRDRVIQDTFGEDFSKRENTIRIP